MSYCAHCMRPTPNNLTGKCGDNCPATAFGDKLRTAYQQSDGQRKADEESARLAAKAKKRFESQLPKLQAALMQAALDGHNCLILTDLYDHGILTNWCAENLINYRGSQDERMTLSW